MSDESCVVRLRALSGRPLADPKIRGMVASAAAALAERSGLRLLATDLTDDSLTVALATNRLTALGFLAELRRSTDAWYQGKFHAGPLWGTRVDDGGDGGEAGEGERG